MFVDADRGVEAVEKHGFLAGQIAADVLEDYSDGAWLVELAPLTDPSLFRRRSRRLLA